MNSSYTRIITFLAPLLLGGCNMVLFDPKGQIGVSERNLILISFFLMLLVVVPVIIMACLFAYKYRSTNLKATYTPDWSHSHKIEAIVWGVPCLIVTTLCIICWKSSHDLDPAKPIVSSAKPIEIDVVSLDWKWLFIYPEQHIASVNEVAFPVDVPVNFVITSDSVMNSFFIPQLGSQIFAMAGMKVKLNLIANAIGTYQGISANFSGDGFSDMKFKTLVVNQSDFDQWVTKVQHSGEPLEATNYPALVKPSENNPVQYYSSVDPTLFDAIVNKYMSMTMTMNKTTPVSGAGNSMTMPMEH